MGVINPSLYLDVNDYTNLCVVTSVISVMGEDTPAGVGNGKQLARDAQCIFKVIIS